MISHYNNNIETAIKQENEMTKVEMWTEAANLRKESKELLRKAVWQAGCMAEEGCGTEAIDKATAAKMATMAENQARIESLMKEWAA